jgi:uncharacterized protein YutE (UPF0331/DUF86 family)
MNQGYEIVYQYLPWIGLPLLGIVVLMIVRKMYKSSVNRKLRSMGMASGMSMMDIDQMAKKGMISPEEYRRIRHSLARHELDRTQQKLQSERERALIAQAEFDPEAARLLLAQNNPPAKPRPAIKHSAPQTAPGGSSPGARLSPPPLGPPIGAPTGPPAGTPPRDIDILLKKGIITGEEYERMKKFIGG